MEVDALERSLDAPEVGLGLDVRDQEHVDVSRPEVLGDETIVCRENLRHETAEHDEEYIFVTQLVSEPDERQLGARPCLACAPFIHLSARRRAVRSCGGDR